MEFFKTNINVDFMRYRKAAGILSIVLSVFAIAVIAINGINLGLDFTGGTVVELGYQQPPDMSEIRKLLHSNGFPDAVVQNYGTTTDVLIRIAPRNDVSEEEVAKQMLDLLRDTQNNDVKLLRVNVVGAQVGKELLEKGGMALLLALLLTAMYIAFRFEYRFAISAALALAHDPIFVLGIFALFKVEFDLPTLAALLAVIGYSLNDTIVVFDRVRENFVKIRKGSPADIVNKSLNQTLARTIMTSFLTLLVVIALLVYGGPSIHGFALALFIGIVVGTYSSIYIASSTALTLGLTKQDMMPPSKDDTHSILS